MFVQNMKLFVFLLILSVAAFARIDIAPYQSYVDSVVPGSRYGFSVRSVKTGKELVNVRGDEKFTPASTLKTVTTAAALHYLPLDYEPVTTVSLDGSLQGKTFVGSIRVHGEGDPNFSGRYYADPFFMLYAMADSIRQVGVDTLRGFVDLDTSFYKGPWRAEHWRKNFYDAWYGAEIAPLNFNDNCTMVRFKPGASEGDTAVVSILPDVGYVSVKNELVTVAGKKRKWTWALDSAKSQITLGGTIGLKVDSAQLVLPIRNPVGYFRAAFQQALKERGIVYVPDLNVQAGIEVKRFSFSAAPLLSILDEINQRSQNFHAEALFRNLGALRAGDGSVDGGKAVVQKFLNELELDPNDFEMWDGCGLSPKNKLKPSVETEFLAKMARHPKGDFYINSFASPGVGTAGKRQLDNPYPWLTRLKTGFIGEAHALVGYVFPMDGDTLAVAMYLNETGKNPDGKLKDVLDTLWTRLVMEINGGYASLLEMKALWHGAKNIHGLANRLDYFSEKLLGRPYRLGPMGEGYLDSIETKPLVYMDSLDCVTFLEHVLAMSLAHDEKNIFDVLQKVRYRDGRIRYADRKHFMLVDWVGEGKFAKVLPMDGDTSVYRTMPKKDFFGSKGIKCEGPDAQSEIRYLPYEKSLAWASKPWGGNRGVMGVAFVAKSEKLDATHTGFIILRPGELPKLRHASSAKKQVVEQPFNEYLESRRGKLPGVTLFEFLK